jgi:lipoprotein-anchoring transpeptidase ErfK/SrfK
MSAARPNRAILLRVVGVSHGVADDPNVWWATTEGYVGLHSLRAATSDWAKRWSVPSAELAPQGWWGEVSQANVRAGPTTDAPVVGEFAGGEHVKVLAEEQGDAVGGDPTWYRLDGGRFAGGYVHASLVQHLPPPQPTVAPPPEGTQLGDKPWIVVDRPAHTLTLLKSGQPVFVTYVSLGQAGKDTPEGNYTTWGKYRADRMSNAANPDADHGYNVPNVPFVQYYKDGGFAIHGTYWHDQFGTDESQGCINVTWTDAAYLFGQTLPQLPSDAPQLIASGAQEATPLEIKGS